MGRRAEPLPQHHAAGTDAKVVVMGWCVCGGGGSRPRCWMYHVSVWRGGGCLSGLCAAAYLLCASGSGKCRTRPIVAVKIWHRTLFRNASFQESPRILFHQFRLLNVVFLLPSLVSCCGAQAVTCFPESDDAGKAALGRWTAAFSCSLAAHVQASGVDTIRAACRGHESRVMPWI